MQPGAMIHDMIFKYMDYASLPSQNEKNEVLSSTNPKNNEQNSPTCSSYVSNSLNDCKEKFSELNLDDTDLSEDNKEEKNNLQNSEVPYNNSAMYFLPVNYNKRNPWRRIIGLHVNGHVSSIYLFFLCQTDII